MLLPLEWWKCGKLNDDRKIRRKGSLNKSFPQVKLWNRSGMVLILLSQISLQRDGFFSPLFFLMWAGQEYHDDKVTFTCLQAWKQNQSSIKYGIQEYFMHPMTRNYSFRARRSVSTTCEWSWYYILLAARSLSAAWCRVPRRTDLDGLLVEKILTYISLPCFIAAKTRQRACACICCWGVDECERTRLIPRPRTVSIVGRRSPLLGAGEHDSEDEWLFIAVLMWRPHMFGA